MHSCLYEGRVTHRRHMPVVHAFAYRVFMVYLDLGELADVFRGRWLWSTTRPSVAWFRRADHLGEPTVPLDEAVRRLVEERTGRRPAGPIRLLTNLRYVGLVMNPVSFYFCFDPADRHAEVIVAEVHNTPWNETYCYVLDAAASGQLQGTKTFRHPKVFHVSPFMGMNQQYVWRLTDPGTRLAIHIENHEASRRMFESTLVMERREITGRELARVLVQYPLMTGKVVAAIYWQALRLILRRVPMYTHPSRTASATGGGRG